MLGEGSPCITIGLDAAPSPSILVAKTLTEIPVDVTQNDEEIFSTCSQISFISHNDGNKVAEAQILLETNSEYVI